MERPTSGREIDVVNNPAGHPPIEPLRIGYVGASMGRSIDPEEPQQRFLEKAKEAEDNAEHTKDGQVRNTWLILASGYRELAKVHGLREKLPLAPDLSTPGDRAETEE